MATKVQLIDGQFQDSAGNPLSGGYLEFELSQDGAVNGSIQVAAGSVLTAPLDSNGNINEASNFSLWPNDAITPANTFYNVSAYTEGGQLVWGPNSQQVFSTPNPYNIGVWVPGVVNTSENLEGILLQTDGVNNTSQVKLNLTAGTNITLVSDSSGDVSISSLGSSNAVTAISIANAHGVSGTSSGGTTPTLTFTLGAITPSSVAVNGAQALTGVGGNGTKIATQAVALGAANNILVADANGNVTSSSQPVSNLAVTTVNNTWSVEQNFAGGITLGGVLLSHVTGGAGGTIVSAVAGVIPTSGDIATWSTGGNLTDSGVPLSSFALLGGANTFTNANVFSGGRTLMSGPVSGSLITGGSGVITGTEGTVPYMALVNSHQTSGANNSAWDWYVDGTGSLHARAVLDDGSAGNDWMAVSRAGDTPNIIELNGTVLMSNISLNSAVFSSTATGGSSTLPTDPAGFIEIVTQSGAIKIPYYNI